MRSVFRPSLFAAAAALLAIQTPVAMSQQQSTVREEARVTLVEVPVNVIDRDGKPVENLTPEDFEVLDDGKKQTITGFDVLDQRRPLSRPAPGDAPIHPAAQRHFLLLFDLTFASPKGVVNARRAARDFVVSRLKELDTVAVATYSVEHGMRLLVTFTRDRTQAASAIDTLGFPTLADRSSDPLGFVIRTPSPSNAEGFSSLGSISSPGQTNQDVAVEEALENLELHRSHSFRAIYRDRVRRFMASFAQMGQALDAVAGRKHILFLSEGFDSRELQGSTSQGGGSREAEWVIRGQSWKVDSDARFGNAGLRSAMTDALAVFNRADAVIHSVDIGGLRAASDVSGGSDQMIDGSGSLFFIAKETGGEFLKNANDLGSAFDRLLDRTGLIYILAFQPVRVPETGKFHTLTVKARNRSYRVSHRTGYYEAKKYFDLTPMEKKLATSSAIAAANPHTDIPAWVLAAPFPSKNGASRVPVIVEVPGDRLLSRSAGAGVMNVELYAYAMDARGETRDYLFQQIGLDLAKVAPALRKTGLKYYGQLSLAPGEYTLRVLVRDTDSGRFGMSVVPLSVPNQSSPDPFALPPIFLDRAEGWVMVKGKPRTDRPAGDYPFAIAGESFIPAALADVHSGEDMQVCLIAYNFGNGPSPLDYSGRILSVDGRPKGRVDLTLLKSSDLEREGARKLLLRFRPSGLEPGRYALAVQLKDPRSGKSTESSFPFDVQ